ncbi:hypothetical protein LXA43DRAFT_1061568 [Ganoderma leucocontextum]|nr:hypothetical protein LXA43DRAFT_1061568 [Ganoderma leucocontextum]
MWLLSTHRAELSFFPTPESVPGGYAILSHCWDSDEQTFQDVQALKARCAKTPGENPRDFVSRKIQEFCILAELQGYAWGWADMCCIDKSSSAELSEAIKSMFRYYSLAGVCYAFLHDVPTGCVVSERDSEFRRSRWHERGWTLQELIAPEKVVFLSEDWEPLATKLDIAWTLQEITRIPVDVLTSMKAELPKTCMATRLSWAAGRETTRPEDEAYCLLGLLDVDMYTSYGEGRQAFYRLQEELIKRSTDTSLFVWGGFCRIEDLVGPEDQGGVAGAKHRHSLESFLFAPRPSVFQVIDVNPSSNRGFSLFDSGPPKVRFTPKQSKINNYEWSSDISRRLTYSLTPHGICAHFPIAKIKHQSMLAVAFLACSVDGDQVGLILNECSNDDASAPIHPLYDTGGASTKDLLAHQDVYIAISSTSTARLAKFTYNDLNGGLIFEWRDIYIRARPQDSITFDMLWLERAAITTMSSFIRLPDRLRDTYDVRPMPRVPSGSDSERWGTPLHGWEPWSETYMFYSLRAVSRVRDPFLVHLGLCVMVSDPRAGPAIRPHSYALWARASSMPETPPSYWPKPFHICHVDHLDSWSRKYEKTFDIAFPKPSVGTSQPIIKHVQLRFTPPPDHQRSPVMAIMWKGETGPWDLAVAVVTGEAAASEAQAGPNLSQIAEATGVTTTSVASNSSSQERRTWSPTLAGAGCGTRDSEEDESSLASRLADTTVRTGYLTEDEDEDEDEDSGEDCESGDGGPSPPIPPRISILAEVIRHGDPEFAELISRGPAGDLEHALLSFQRSLASRAQTRRPGSYASPATQMPSLTHPNSIFGMDSGWEEDLEEDSAPSPPILPISLGATPHTDSESAPSVRRALPGPPPALQPPGPPTETSTASSRLSRGTSSITH